MKTRIAICTFLAAVLALICLGASGPFASNVRVVRQTNGEAYDLILPRVTASRAMVTDANQRPTNSVTTAAQLAFVSGVTSSIQGQLDLKASTANLNTASNVLWVAIGEGSGGDVFLAQTNVFTQPQIINSGTNANGLTITQTWNNGSVTYSGLRIGINYDGGNGADSTYLDISQEGSPIFVVRQDAVYAHQGNVYFTGTVWVTNALYSLVLYDPFYRGFYANRFGYKTKYDGYFAWTDEDNADSPSIDTILTRSAAATMRLQTHALIDGNLTFGSGTTYSGIKLKNLTTAQWNAIADGSGIFGWDTDADRPIVNDGTDWKYLAYTTDAGGGSILTNTGTGSGLVSAPGGGYQPIKSISSIATGLTVTTNATDLTLDMDDTVWARVTYVDTILDYVDTSILDSTNAVMNWVLSLGLTNLTKDVASTFSGLIDGHVFTWDGTARRWTNRVATGGGGGGGETNTASNLGSGGVGLFAGKSGANLQFQSLNGSQFQSNGTIATIKSGAEVTNLTVRSGLLLPHLADSTVPILDENSRLTNSQTSTVKLGYLNNVTSDIQTQLNAKASIDFTTNLVSVTSNALKSAMSGMGSGNFSTNAAGAAVFSGSVTVASNLYLLTQNLTASSQTTNFIFDFAVADATNALAASIHFQHSTNHENASTPKIRRSFWTGGDNRAVSYNTNWSHRGGGRVLTLWPSNTMVLVYVERAPAFGESGVRFWVDLPGTNSMNDQDVIDFARSVGTRVYTNNVLVGVATNVVFIGNVQATTASGTNTITIGLGSTNSAGVAAGYVGEVIESAVTNAATAATDTEYNVTSVALTPGHWCLSSVHTFIKNGATFTTPILYSAISPTSGNASTGEQAGFNAAVSDGVGSAFTQFTLSIPDVFVYTPTNKTYYLKGLFFTLTAGAPLNSGRLSAERYR